MTPADLTRRPVYGWHFAAEDRRLRYGDGRRIEPGVTFRVEGPLRMCDAGNGFGLFASTSPLDALRYGAGPVVSRVILRGEIITGADKLVAREREHLWVADATDTLVRFARLCALDVAHLWDAPEIVRRYLRMGDESIRDAAWAAASDAARDAGGAAARAAASAAAWAAARTAARDVGWAAARAAAWAADWTAAGAADWDLTRDAQARRLHRMLLDIGRTQ